MRSLFARPLGRLVELLGSGGRRWRVLAPCLVLCVAGGLASAGDAGGRQYSAYSDTKKPVLSFLLSEKENVRDFRETFGLDGRKTEEALSIVRAENERLAEEHAESEKLVAANRSLPDEEISGKIAASDYDETVASAVEATKDGIAALLPKAERDQFPAWVDERWREEVAEASEEGSARVVESKGKGGRSLVCDRIFATQYNGYTRFEAALPHRGLKFGSRPEVPIKRGKRTIRPRIKEVGPWNTYDNYWQTGKKRDMWRNLPRCQPEAQAAYFREYNRGKDEFGREVLNPAGVDLTPAAARRLGLDRYQNAWVDVRFPWVRR
jgi:hypothetical protein